MPQKSLETNVLEEIPYAQPGVSTETNKSCEEIPCEKRSVSKNADQVSSEKRLNYNPGIVPGDKGNMYQKRTTLFLALLAYITGKVFKIAFEVSISIAGKFDDIVLEIDNYRYFVQVKHVSTGRKIDYQMLFLPKGDFSIQKYYESWKNDIKDRTEDSSIDNFILLTNTTVADNTKDLFFEKIEETDEQLKNITGALPNVVALRLKGSNANTDEEFIEVTHNINERKTVTFKIEKVFAQKLIFITGMPNLANLEKEVINLVRDKVVGSAENVFHMLEYELTGFFHSQNKDATSDGRKWLTNSFEMCREKNYLHFFETSFHNTVEVCSNVTFNTNKCSPLQQKEIAILEYEDSYDMQMIQAKQMVGTGRFYYTPLECLTWSDSMKSCMLKALDRQREDDVAIENNNTKRNTLILLDQVEYRDMIGDVIKKLPTSSITKLIIITNRCHAKTDETARKLLTDWKILPPAPQITLEDLNLKDGYKIMFQGVEISLEMLPSHRKFQTLISGKLLVDLIRSKVINVGADLPSLTECYQPRKLALTKIEINNNTVVIVDAAEFHPTENETYYADSAIENQIVDKCVDCNVTLHFLKKVGNKWQWSHSLPCTSTIINDANKIAQRTNSNDMEMEWENSIAVKNNSVYKPLIANSKVVLENVVDETEFFEKNKSSIAIISGETGAGKSTTIRRLARIHKEKFPGHWVNFINLSGHALIENGKIAEDMNQNWINRFLLTAVTDKENVFEKAYFESCLPKDIIVFIDSFDEICKKYIGKAWNLVKILNNMNYRIVIGSRLYQQYLLRSEWSDCHAYHLIPLSFDDQYKVMKRLLEAQGKSVPESAKQHLQYLQNKLSRGNSKVSVEIGESLVIVMLAQIISHQPDSVPVFDRLTLSELFYKFFESYSRKVGDLKLNQNGNRNYSEEEVMGRFEWNCKHMGILVSQARMPKADFNKVFKKTELESFYEQNVESGLWTAVVSPNLNHRAFEDFYFAFVIRYSYVDLESDDFWNIYGTYMKGLVAIFFFYLISKRLEKNLYDNYKEEYKKMVDVFQKIYPLKIIDDFFEKHKLNGCLELLRRRNQNCIAQNKLFTCSVL